MGQWNWKPEPLAVGENGLICPRDNERLTWEHANMAYASTWVCVSCDKEMWKEFDFLMCDQHEYTFCLACVNRAVRKRQMTILILLKRKRVPLVISQNLMEYIA